MLFIFRIFHACARMVRTYAWNPSTQSNLTIGGSFNNESKKAAANSPPVESANLYSTPSFSNGPIYRPNYKNGQVTNTSTTTAVTTDDAQNDTAASNSLEFLPPCNSDVKDPKRMPLPQPHHQSFPVCYPIPLHYPLYHCQLHLLSPQITTPLMFEQTKNLKSIDLWYLRPIQIGNKVYYEPVSSKPVLCRNPTSILPYSATSSSLVAIPNNDWSQNVSPSMLL